MPVEMSNDMLINLISPSFRHFVKGLWHDLNFGLCRSRIEIDRVKSSTGNKNALADQFTLIFPYGGKSLKWEILFDISAPCFPPDFVFDDDMFLEGDSVDDVFIEKNVPSLASWNDADPGSLSRVISELMALFRAHQRKMLAEDENSRAFFEYSALLGDCAVKETDIEVLVTGNDCVNFLIKLDVNMTHLPLLFSESFYHNPGGECALLLVKYPNPSNAELILSPLVKKAVGNLQLPPMHQSAVLMDYVPMVTELLNKKISLLLQNDKLRKELLSQLVVKYEGALLEHDMNSASLLFDVNNFHWIMHIDIGPNFPEKPPCITLKSVLHTFKGKARMKTLPACPYSQFEDYIKEQVEIFKLECIGSTSMSTSLPIDI